MITINDLAVLGELYNEGLDALSAHDNFVGMQDKPIHPELEEASYHAFHHAFYVFLNEPMESRGELVTMIRRELKSFWEIPGHNRPVAFTA